MRMERHNSMDAQIKTIGASGQISLGKQYAGRTVLIEQVEEGVWHVRTAQVIPDNEKWLHRPEVAASLDRAIKWAEEHPTRETTMAELEAIERKLLRRRRK
jgi:hypothetical protein